MAEHIRIGDVAPRVQYAADGAQNAFTYPFPIFDAEDLEVMIAGQSAPAGYIITGAGVSEGGSVVFAAPPAAGALITLRRRVRVERVTDFQPNGLLRANALNDELDRQVAGLQDLGDEVGTSLRLHPSEAPGGTVLPLRAVRANQLLGFDSNGAVTVLPRSAATMTSPFLGAIPRTVEDKLAERLSARDFGTLADGISDDGPALQAAMNAAASAGKLLEIGEGTHRTTMPLLLGGAAAGLLMKGSILYAGPDGSTALTLGDGAAVRNAVKSYTGLRVTRATICDWTNEADIGIVARNLDSSILEVRQVEGFTIGIRTLGVERGFEDSQVFLGRIVNNHIGLDVRTETAAAWNTSVRYYGGHFAQAFAVHTDKDRYGVRFSAAPGAYVAHNRHVFDGPAFELQSRDRPIAGVPFLMEVNSRAVIVRNMRMEGCDQYVARHTAGAQDHVYEVAWASQGYGVEVEYPPSATRTGAVIRRHHQAIAHRESVRELASVPNMRAASIRWNATEVGFEKLAMLSTNVSGTPTTLSHFAFPALDSINLTDHGAVLVGGRGIGFVVDSRACRDFALAVDADSPRLIVQAFDASMTLLTDAAGQMVRASGQTMQFSPGARWWQGTSDMNDTNLTRLQTVHLEPQVAYAIIGIGRLTSDFEVRSMRLACDPAFSPSVLYGQPGLPHGVRELIAEMAWDPASVAGGASATLNVSVPGARPGDFCQAAFSLATSGMVFLAQIGATDVVTVTAWNRSGVAIDLAAGTVRVRVTKA
ncbi:phage tail fiber protein [Humitalea sp. 24SJ18S-53]|uniref:phage tail fiber protein n=1 Tax=Humitalea sp. 24SJ18S-53 TaxID=3422307 RepID=UPI003D6767C5